MGFLSIVLKYHRSTSTIVLSIKCEESTNKYHRYYPSAHWDRPERRRGREGRFHVEHMPIDNIYLNEMLVIIDNFRGQKKGLEYRNHL